MRRRRGGAAHAQPRPRGGAATPAVLIACALEREGAAVRRALRRRSGTAGVELVVTGLGQDAAAAAAATWVGRAAAVVVCGVAGGCGGLAHRGDVVVASRLIDARGAELPTPVHIEVIGAMAGAVASVGRPVDDPAERAAMLALGAVALETEAAAWARACTAAGIPFAVVRGVLDTPQEPLRAAACVVRPGATAPAAGAVAGLAVRPRTWPGLLRLARTAGAVERSTAAVAVRVAQALRDGW